MFSSFLAVLFFISLLATEFFYIEAWGGVLRPYHILLLMVLAIFLPGLHALWRSPTFRCLALLNLVSIFSALLSADPSAALTSYALFALNSGLAAAVAVIVNLRVLSLEGMVSILYKFAIVSAVFSLLQFGVFNFAGANMALSYQQQFQIAMNLAPSVFTEANTYAKFLIVPFFIFLPLTVSRKSASEVLMFYALLITVFSINFMRTAVFGVFVSIVLMILYYAFTGRLRVVAGRVRILLWGGALLLCAGILSGVSISEYNIYKVATLFDLDAVETDGSWQYRSAIMDLAIQRTVQDPYRIVLGNGWGQVRAYIGDAEVQVGGADLVNFFVYDGVLGVIAYVTMIGFAFRSAIRTARWGKSVFVRSLSEGVLFALIACVTAAFVSGMILMPSFWMLIGIAIVFDRLSAREMARGRLVELRGPVVR